ncbi:uroporphyrinogen decarboxylase family protein [Vallitalea pronyensis]|nr:uroporphyrinogen decarboxylase family protein [Vallitalea pronyensis]
MGTFIPNYKHILHAARNIKPERMPLYEHIISIETMEQITHTSFGPLINGDLADKREFMKHYTGFFKEMGYDTVSMECCIGPIMPGSGALGGHQPGVIKTREDFQRYPWDDIPSLFFKQYSDLFQLLEEEMPEGMKAIGGPGNGVFECVQELVGYTELCYLSVDDPHLYDDIFHAVGHVMYKIWERFLQEFGDTYTVCRFGDDLGYKSQTLISTDSIKKNVVPEYKKIIELVHHYKKPFLLHSCGHIFDVMEDLIHVAGIDAKHSNEDQIAPFSEWIHRYGDQIGNFGGVDMDVLCRCSQEEIKDYVNDVMAYSINHKGFALGSGNSIPGYVPVEGYLTMVETARRFRGE